MGNMEQSTLRRGKRSRGLTIDQIARLEQLRRNQQGWSWPQLKLAMGKDCPFKLKTLLRAADGGVISEKNHDWLAKWLDTHMPAQPLPQDGKMRAAADDSQENGETPEIAPQQEKTNRGSR
jgi:hypothetical protein